MMAAPFKNAVLAAILTAILTIPLLGLQLQLHGYLVVLHTHWQSVIIAVAAVFLFQLCKPMLARSSQAIRVAVAVKLPPLPKLTAGRKSPSLPYFWTTLSASQLPSYQRAIFPCKNPWVEDGLEGA